MSKFKSAPLYQLLGVIAVILLATLFGPEEKSLGANVRIVYLHGAWVLAAEVAFIVAGLAGLIGLLTRREAFHDWSAALGRTGTVFWITYLPLSLLAMQTNWNGLFLSEPRFRLALTFAIVGALMQTGLWLVNHKVLTSIANLAYIIALRIIFSMAANVMHPPPSPIFNSGLWDVIIFFVLLNLLAWLAAYFLTRWFLTLQKSA